MASSSNRIPPCAACKFIGQKCLPECVHAPCFPSNQPAKLVTVHRVFGFNNVTKLLNELHPWQRQDAVNSLVYQAEMRLRDPVYGCVGVISLLQQQLRQLEIDLYIAKTELSKYQNLSMTWAYDQGLNVTGSGRGVAADDHHHYDFFNNNNNNLGLFTNFEVGSSSNGTGYDANGLIGLDGSARLFQQGRGNEMVADGQQTQEEPSS